MHLHLCFPYLFELDGLGELPAEGEVGDGDVVEDDAELLRALRQLGVDRRGDDLTLRDQLARVELRHHRLQNLYKRVHILPWVKCLWAVNAFNFKCLLLIRAKN